MHELVTVTLKFTKISDHQCGPYTDRPYEVVSYTSVTKSILYFDNVIRFVLYCHDIINLVVFMNETMGFLNLCL